MRKFNCKDSANREQNCQACLSCFAEMQPILWKDSANREQNRACQSYLILILSGIVNKRKFPDNVRLFFGDLLRLAIGNFSSSTITAPHGLKESCHWHCRYTNKLIKKKKLRAILRANCVQFFHFQQYPKNTFLRYVIAL